MNMQKKERLKKAAGSLGLKILWGGLACLIWTFTMLLVIIIVDDINVGTKLFIYINGSLYQLYAALVGIGLFLFLINDVFKKQDENIPEVIVHDPRQHRNKNKNRHYPK